MKKLVPALLVLASCAHDAPATRTSTIDGTVATATFPGAVTHLEAKSEAGVVTGAPLDAAGRFSLILEKGHSYSLSVATSSATTPLVFPRSSGRIDRAVSVSKGAAHVDVGTVRFLPHAPVGGFSAATGSMVCPGVASSEMGCVDDAARVRCDGESAHEAPDGECENGHDKATGAACSDAEPADGDLAEAAPRAVAERNAPGDVSSCDDGDGEDPND